MWSCSGFWPGLVRGRLGSPRNVFKAWYALFFSSQVCLLPYLALHFQHSGLTPRDIGLLLALQPWINAPAGFIWSWLADCTGLHKFLLLVNLPTSVFLRAAVVLSDCHPCFVALVVMTEVTGAPVTALVDVAAVSCCEQDADYGKLRLWGGVGWGAFSACAGWIIQRWGLRAALVPYFVLAAPCILLTACMGSWEPKSSQDTQQVKVQSPSKAQRPEGDERDKLLQLSRRSPKHHSKVTFSEDMQLEAGNRSTDIETGVHHRQHTHQGQNRRHVQYGQHSQHEQQVQRTQHSHQGLQGQYGERQHLRVGQHLDQLDEGDDLGEVVPEGWDRGNLSYGHNPDGGPCAHNRDPHGPDADLHESNLYEIGLQEQELQGWESPEKGSREREQQHERDLRERRVREGETRGGGPWEGDLREKKLQGREGEDRLRGGLPRLSGLGKLLSDPHVLCFLFLGCLMGFGLGLIGSFIFLLLEELNGSKTLMGLTMTVTCMSEIPVFHLQSAVLQHLSLRLMLHVVALSYVLRLLCYALLPWWGSPWAVLPVELLHGLTFACAWGLGTVQARRLAHPGLETSMQGLYQGIFFGVGSGLGALAGGFISSRWGYQAMYFCGALIMLLGYLVYALLEQLVLAWSARHRNTYALVPASDTAAES